MKKLIIGIDIDETITETKINVDKYAKIFGLDYEDYHLIPKSKFNLFMSKYNDIIMETDELKENVNDFFNYCDNKHKIILITARSNEYSKNTCEITKKYLEKHSLKYDKIIFSDCNKGISAKENNVDIFIDDKEEVLDDIAKYNIECIRFTNKQSKYKTFNNWLDILEYIKKKEG